MLRRRMMHAVAATGGADIVGIFKSTLVFKTNSMKTVKAYQEYFS